MRPGIPLAAALLLSGGAWAQVASKPATPAPAAPAEGSSLAGGTLTIVSDVDGVPVSLDGAPLGVTPLPAFWTVTAGRHTIRLAPPGQAAVDRQVEVAAGQNASVSIALSGAPPAAGPQSETEGAAEERPPSEPPGPPMSTATVGYVAAGVGLLAAGAGVWFGLDANAKAGDARAYDVEDPSNTRAAQQRLIDDAGQAALMANLSFGAAAVSLAGAAVLLITSSEGPFGTTLTPISGGAALGGRF